MKKRIITLSGIAFGVLCVAFGAILLVWAQKEPVQIPRVTSNTESVEVLQTRLETRNHSERNAKIYLRNNSDKVIIAFTAESGNEKDSESFSQVRFADGTGPVARPKEQFNIDVPVGNFVGAMSIRINAIVFDDGSASGEPAAVGKLTKIVEQAIKDKGRRVNPK